LGELHWYELLYTTVVYNFGNGWILNLGVYRIQKSARFCFLRILNSSGLRILNSEGFWMNFVAKGRYRHYFLC
jgi:hypothetical protein